jgi:hypothetical protein
VIKRLRSLIVPCRSESTVKITLVDFKFLLLLGDELEIVRNISMHNTDFLVLIGDFLIKF